jgi:hypothetical protein
MLVFLAGKKCSKDFHEKRGQDANRDSDSRMCID